MATFYVNNNVYQGTSSSSTPVVAAPVYEARAVFSINASNQLQGTIWVTKNGQLVINDLTTAAYTVYDNNGNIIGMSESGIAPDGNAQFKITPINASAINDLTHYVVKLSVGAEGQNRTGYVGITLGE